MSFSKGLGETDGKTGRRESRLLVISEVYTLFIGAALVASVLWLSKSLEFHV